MTHHITADRLVETAIKAVTEELFRDFDNTLRTLCDEEDDRKAVFRTLRYARIRLHVLCGYISKEEASESDTQIRFLHIVIGYIDTELEILNRYGDTYSPKPHVCKRRWTGAVVEIVELIYALHEMKRIDDGEIAMNELAGFFGELFGIRLDARNLYDAYTDIKRRKGDSRTYFLDKLRERLNLRMQRDDEKEQEQRR
ncbi:RteC domain-containing protein [Bacteroides salyersiae]|uniref:RteC domain-containing protein n=1 Tax=Bacteroides salyersiae TaxID=291644 RepID=UPI0021658B02|nr:RteC domain-containing protein [Bacteroides salyersiae]MCS3059217.1 RteC domain-containing protein [Bacteroides salyersiae]